MDISSDSLLHINSFFDSYTRALELYDSKGLAWLHMLPCTFVEDELQTVYTEASKLEGFFNLASGFYKQYGIVHASPTVWTKRRWSDKMANALVNWQYYDADKKPLYNCDCQYVLKLDKNDDWKIVLSASINEKERMEAWLKGK